MPRASGAEQVLAAAQSMGRNEVQLPFALPAVSVWVPCWRGWRREECRGTGVFSALALKCGWLCSCQVS